MQVDLRTQIQILKYTSKCRLSNDRLELIEVDSDGPGNRRSNVTAIASDGSFDAIQSRLVTLCAENGSNNEPAMDDGQSSDSSAGETRNDDEA